MNLSRVTARLGSWRGGFAHPPPQSHIQLPKVPLGRECCRENITTTPRNSPSTTKHGKRLDLRPLTSMKDDFICPSRRAHLAWLFPILPIDEVHTAFSQQHRLKRKKTHILIKQQDMVATRFCSSEMINCNGVSSVPVNLAFRTAHWSVPPVLFDFSDCPLLLFASESPFFPL